MQVGLLAQNNRKYLRPGTLFCTKTAYEITTVLGSCISVCLWDPVSKIGGMNHYLLPLWNGEGLPSPKYGNIANTRLIERMLELGANKKRLKAKVFGGSSNFSQSTVFNVSERNIILARDMLQEAGIPIISSEVGGQHGRKIILSTATGTVRLKRLQNNMIRV